MHDDITDISTYCRVQWRLCLWRHSRHTTASHLLRAGVDINTIRGWLGHLSVDTTNVYAETDLATKAKALAVCDPGSRPRKPNSKWRDDPDLMQFLHSL